VPVADDTSVGTAIDEAYALVMADVAMVAA
jgi:hypothetical protein